MSSTYSNNGYNGESPLIMSLPDLVPSTNSLPPYGSSRKEDNDSFDSIYYNPPAEVKREPLSPRIPTPLPPHIPTPIANHKANKSLTTMSPSTPLTEPPTLDNLWFSTSFRASYNVWGNTINNHKSPSPSPPLIRQSGRVLSIKCWNCNSPSYHPETPDYIRNPQPLPPVPTPTRSPVPIPTPPPRPWTPPTVIPAYVEPEVGLTFTWPPPPLQRMTARGPNGLLASAHAKHLDFLNEKEIQACHGVQAALELWMTWARLREQHVNARTGRDFPQIALVYRQAPPPPNNNLYIPRTVNFDGPLPTNNIRADIKEPIQLPELPGPSWDQWNKFTGSQQLAFQEKYWA
ncbi:hypothetical protein JAAARDRAFT_188516 [Jaapia argillacea MUCL 33604]|uniref:Uncharacterized protein n=1 Tax=Jaapia argillacea MUCL 33604 TaxID=933084 RepID=A0A067QJS9_9AGAM|nr:hypothetical protein JAAARDRAFT_188516 [Jaapia argillacea MUCL 33604]